MKSSTKIGTSLVGIVLAASLAGCGDDGAEDASAEPENTLADMSATQIKDEVQTDMKTVTSMTLDGQIQQSSGTLSMDLTLDDAGNCQGTMAMDEASAEIMVVDGASYLKGGEQFWTTTAGPQGAQIAKMIGDKWAKMPAGSGGFSEVCQLDTFLEGITEDDGSSVEEDTITKGEVSEVEGTEALEITAEGEDGTTTMWIATGEKNYIVKMTREGDEPGEFVFSDYNEPVEVEAPAEGEFVDMSTLGG